MGGMSIISLLVVFYKGRRRVVMEVEAKYL
jgi:hypothetical protein